MTKKCASSIHSLGTAQYDNPWCYTSLLMQSFWFRLHLVSWTVLVLLLGYFLGLFVLRVEQTRAPAPIKVLNRDVHRRAPIVYIQEINDGDIVGVVGTGARLVIGDTVVIPKPDRSFRIAADPFLVNVFDVPIPRGVLYVASKRGKNYYPVDSSAGQRLVPDNRIYFRTAVEAEALGYKDGS